MAGKLIYSGKDDEKCGLVPLIHLDPRLWVRGDHWLVSLPQDVAESVLLAGDQSDPYSRSLNAVEDWE